MGISDGVGVVVEGVRASAAALGALVLDDEALGAGAGVDVLQRRYELCLE
ncbi:hypothetical protein HNO81_10875, partial [Pseudarthrobacter sp. C4D7]|nr:hypothetical protein [Pseudarthrobacter sp. C4D7]